MLAKKGQNLCELPFIGVYVLGIALICFFAFGGNLAYIFEKSNVANLFSGNRTAKTVDNSQYLSKASLSVNGQNFKSPVETVINGELSSGANVETSGGVGNLKETVKVAQQYIDQLTTLLQNPPPNSPDSTELIKSLNAYNTATNDYIAQNGAYATDPLLQLINEIKIAINLNQQGTLATGLNSNAQTYLNSLPNSQYKNLLTIYINDLMNLGASINYTIDSRYFTSLVSPTITSTTTSTPSTSASTTTVTSVYTATTSNDTTAVQVSNVYNTLESAYTAMITNNGVNLASACSSYNSQYSASNCIMNLFSSYFSTTNSCTAGNSFSGGCWASTIYNISGSADNSNWNEPAIDLSNGMALSMVADASGMSDNCTYRSGSLNNICGQMAIDLNGTAGPNTLGDDVFMFWITSTGILPSGTPGDAFAGDCIPGNNASSNYGYSCAQQIINLANSIPASSTTTTTSTSLPVLGQSSNNLTVLEQLEQELTQIDNNPAITLDQKTQIAKFIEIYREGSYSQIMPNSYNSAVLCNSLGAAISNSICNVSL